jgi:hypothetical protein
VAGRFGLAPTASRHTTAGLKLYEDKSAGLSSGDPSGAHALRWPAPPLSHATGSSAAGSVRPSRKPASRCRPPGSTCATPARPLSGFTAVDVLALGAMGHIFGVGLVLGLKATGTL